MVLTFDAIVGSSNKTTQEPQSKETQNSCTAPSLAHISPHGGSSVAAPIELTDKLLVGMNGLQFQKASTASASMMIW